DPLKVIVILFASIPLALLYPLLPPAPSLLTPAYSLAVSYIFLTQVLHLHNGFFQLLGSSIATYYLVAWRVSKSMGWEVFALTMGHLLFNHLYRSFNEISLDIIEITGSQMVLVMKLSSFAWQVYDGQRPKEELDKFQSMNRIEELPTLLDFLSYCFFFPSIMAGPSFTYASYRSFINRTLFGASKDNPSQFTLPPGRWYRAGKRFACGVFYLAIFATQAGSWSFSNLVDPRLGWLDKPLWKRIFAMQMGGFMARTKYYAVWCLAETAYILSGLGWDPISRKYINSRNLKIRQIECAQSFKELLDHWNMNTNVWLRECVYKRVAREGKKPGFKSTMATFGTSAFWHGTNPCYYLTFFLGGFAQNLGKLLRKNIRPFFLPPGYLLIKPGQPTPPTGALKAFYDIVGIISVQLVLNFAVVPFMLQDFRQSFTAWNNVNWYGLILVFGISGFFWCGG
ncbi:MBOAT-domain-containing protein, partial [Atractiella rhizophila]